MNSNMPIIAPTVWGADASDDLSDEYAVTMHWLHAASNQPEAQTVPEFARDDDADVLDSMVLAFSEP